MFLFKIKSHKHFSVQYLIWSFTVFFILKYISTDSWIQYSGSVRYSITLKQIYKWKVMNLAAFTGWNKKEILLLLLSSYTIMKQALIVIIRCLLLFIFMILFFISTGFPFFSSYLMLLDILVQVFTWCSMLLCKDEPLATSVYHLCTWTSNQNPIQRRQSQDLRAET